MPALQRKWPELADRRLFVPGTIWIQRVELGPLVPLHREEEPGLWDKHVAADESVITQVSDGWLPTSSSSAPSMMSQMLDALDLEPGMRVLEIGTGTGWNAAIMAAAGAIVTSIEIDGELAVHAREALAGSGFGGVVVLHGEGELGAPAYAPFDRLIATAAAHTVPYPWVEQTVDGGRIVLPYAGKHHPGGLAVLTVTAGVASGRVIDRAAFMSLRGQRLNPPQKRKLSEPAPGATVRIRVGPRGQRVTSRR